MYRDRIVEQQLDFKLDTFGATLIVGPKGCGKTTTAKHKAKSFIELQDEDRRDEYLLVANTTPSKLLVGDKPRLIDEWQDAPKIWGAVRKSVDDEQKTGLYILTGSTSQTVHTPHTGTLRISELVMYPMSLFESGESNGEVSLIDLFDNPDGFDGCYTDLTIDELIFAICRGGWPRAIEVKSDKSKLAVAKEMYRLSCKRDISNIDGYRRNEKWGMSILKSYARNICALANAKTIFSDVKKNTGLSETTYYDYVQAFERLFIIDDVEAWCPAIRSKTSIRASKKKNLVDPSIAVAALGISPSYFNTDFKTLGFLFESLCIRDLKIYSSNDDGVVSYYRDRYGLEADAVLHLTDGRYALIEIKLGENGVEEGAKHLCEIERLIEEHNKKEKIPLRKPDLKLVITGTQYGYRRDDGVFVIPIGCLKN